tara:strand:- start:4282 stop:5013 length:732 start_codon:yes stop_codon:yes gene_type:complete
MNRPKRSESRRQPAIWTSPLASMADADARRFEERIDAQTRPFIITMSLKFIAIILFVGVTIWGKEAITTRTIALPDREAFGVILYITSRALPWAVGTLVFVEVFFRRRLRRRWAFLPVAQLRAVRGVTTASLFLIATIYALVMGSLAANDRSLALVFVMMNTMLAALYLIVSGIRRRVGWDPCCAKCGYPHPDNTLATCPECGRPTPHRSPTAVILGRNVTSIPRITLGLFLLAATAAMLALL